MTSLTRVTVSVLSGWSRDPLPVPWQYPAAAAKTSLDAENRRASAFPELLYRQDRGQRCSKRTRVQSARLCGFWQIAGTPFHHLDKAFASARMSTRQEPDGRHQTRVARQTNPTRVRDARPR